MNNLEKLRAVGEAVYGDKWQSPLSRALGISDRTVRNFVSGKSQPENLSNRLLEAMELEMGKIKAAIDIINSDKLRGDDISTEMITQIADRYEYSDEQDRKAAIDAMNNAVYEETFLSDLEAIAIRLAIRH
ncbi:TPA: hypothetical protein SBQ34_004996 [Raoultella ornithinolytica]|uniref:Uncharacterized protein n=1 Tax=Raoultella ornithinolytica TaxID=54291 RepID=A0ABZ2DSQ2_RAOOR|nr:hypothetical protein [Raoultella ornithinolytica]HAT2346400.1 hypothetical protein [Raoultella ornithinolytica]HAT2401548.1 hypothetical protein [Raoultella ornithinolytica]HAT2438983.1 hypothetical protein [Raoultella ornithinolytica]HAT2444678.1 hypothetical protein [Raoultella ornithinolytica]